MPSAARESLLTEIRKSRGLSLGDVAAKVDCTRATLSRIERGVQTPKQAVARKLYRFFGGTVPLGMVYDATFRER